MNGFGDVSAIDALGLSINCSNNMLIVCNSYKNINIFQDCTISKAESLTISLPINFIDYYEKLTLKKSSSFSDESM